MIREVLDMREADLIIYNDVVWTPEELTEELDLRFLVDEEEEDLPDPEEDDEEDEESDDEEPENDDEDPEPEEDGRKRKSADESQALIREAIEAGCKRRIDIIRHTSLAPMTVDKYKSLWKSED